MAAQEVQVRLAPGGDVVVVVAVGHGAADDQEQDFSEWMGDAADIARIIDAGEMVEKDAQA